MKHITLTDKQHKDLVALLARLATRNKTFVGRTDLFCKTKLWQLWERRHAYGKFKSILTALVDDADDVIDADDARENFRREMGIR